MNADQPATNSRTASVSTREAADTPPPERAAERTVDYVPWAERATGTTAGGFGPAVAATVRTRNRLRVINLLCATLFASFVLLAFVRIASADAVIRASGWRSMSVFLPSVLSYAAMAGLMLLVRRPSPRLLLVCEWVTVLTAGVCCGYVHLDKLFDDREGNMREFLRLHQAFAGMAFSFPWYSFALAYGTFIPTGWKQTTAQMGLIVAAPIALTLVVAAVVPDLAPLLLGTHVIVMTGFLGVGYGTMVYSAYAVSKLHEDVARARRVGPYRLGEKIGEGGMGVVYKAQHRLLKRPCAVKLIRPRSPARPDALVRFEREVQAMASLSHWNTVEIYDYGVTEDGDFYYAMELLDGQTVHAAVGAGGPVTPRRTVRILRQMCAALAEAHARNLIHRDVSPRNVFLAHVGGQTDVVKLLDFGLVRYTDDRTDWVSLTADGAAIGTPGYMAPEQGTEGWTLDARADLYSLGAVGFFLLAGRRPFAGDTPMQIMAAQLSGAFDPLAALGPNCPPDLAAVIARCLARSPADRYASTRELDAALAGCEAAVERLDGQVAVS